MLLGIRATLLALVVIAAVGCGGGSGPASRNNGGGDPSSSPGEGNATGPISISPPSDTLRVGGQRQFSGWDSTVGQFDVTWSLQLYKPTSGTFQPTGSMLSPRAQHSGIRLSNGKVLLVGGENESSSAELFDPTSGLFTTTGSLSQARAHASVTLLPNGKVLVLGGTQTIPPGGGGAPPAPVSIGSAEFYDPAAGVFGSTGKLLIARDSHSATLLADGTVLVAGIPCDRAPASVAPAGRAMRPIGLRWRLPVCRAMPHRRGNVRPPDRLSYRLGVDVVALVGLHVRLHILRISRTS
jgi:hypothetical protein